MKRLVGELIFTSLLLGGIQLYGKHEYKKGWKDGNTFSNSLSTLKQKLEDLFKKEEES